MTEVLSPDEIAQLFEAAQADGLPEGPRARAAQAHLVRKIDLSHPMKLSAPEQKRFEREHSAFCMQESVRLSLEMLTDVELEVINSSQLSWGDALRKVPAAALIGVIECADRRAAPPPRGVERRGTPAGQGTMLIAIESGLVLRMIERLLGGSYTDVIKMRSLTDVETVLARGIFEDLLSSLSAVWRKMLGLTLTLVELATDDRRSSLLPMSLPSLELTMNVRDATGSSTIVLLTPYAAIEAASESLAPSVHHDAGAPADAMRAALGEVSIEVRAEVGATTLTLPQVLSLSEGDVVRLGMSGDASVVVGDRRVHRARPGRSSGRRAIKITETGADRP